MVIFTMKDQINIIQRKIQNDTLEVTLVTDEIEVSDIHNVYFDHIQMVNKHLNNNLLVTNPY